MTPSSIDVRTFQMPGHPWPMVKRIVRAYGASQSDENSTVQSVADLANVQRTVVSGNNNFLRSIGVLEIDNNRLTPLGVKLATGIGIENASLIAEAIQEVASTTPILNRLLSTLKARGPMEADAFRGQVILLAGLNQNSPTLKNVKTLIDMLEEGELIESRDNKVLLVANRSVDNGNVRPPAVEPPKETDDSVQHRNATNRKEEHGDPPGKDTGAWADLLLSKFPELDPKWPDEVKLKWFDAFDRLMKGRGL